MLPAGRNVMPGGSLDSYRCLRAALGRSARSDGSKRLEPPTVRLREAEVLSGSDFHLPTVSQSALEQFRMSAAAAAVRVGETELRESALI